MSDGRSLPISPTLPDGACCEACAAREIPPDTAAAAPTSPIAPTAPAAQAPTTTASAPTAAAAPTTASAPTAAAVPAAAALTLPIRVEPARRAFSRDAVDRNDDRRVTILGLAVAAGFLVLAATGVFVPNLHGQWLPLHLVLAGAATTAIAAVMPFFASALVAGEPAPAAARLAIIGLLAAGALMITVGYGSAHAALATSGGLLFITGLVLLLGLTVGILRGSVGAKRRVFTVIYGGAIVNVIVGATLATLFLGGQADVVAHWASLKPAHAWLNLFGFVGVVICASLIHLYPTVLGARMDRSRTSAAGIAAVAFAPAIVALGYALGADVVARAGALLMTAGTLLLLIVAARTWRARGRWTTDARWHAFTAISLSAGLGWFAAGVATAVSGVLVDGAAPAGWSVMDLIAPLGIGFVIQVVMGSWTHLLPSIGPGSPDAHARARVRLATLALPRLALLNAGAALLFAGVLAGNPDLGRAGLALAGLAVLAALWLFGTTALRALREPRGRGATSPAGARATAATR